MDWNWLNIIGVIAFASSGAVVAMEEEYDLLGVLFLGFATSFGGGIMRNVLLGVPASAIWQMEQLLGIALVAILVIFLLPSRVLRRWRRLELFLDAIGLAAFAIQAAITTTNYGFPRPAVMAASLLTGAGGGNIRDVLAGRRPVVFQRGTVYGVWAMAAAAAIGLGWPQSGWPVALLLAFIVGMRMVSVAWRWSLPHRSLKDMDDWSV